MSKLQGPNPLNSLVNWFKYKLPNKTEIYSGASRSLIEGFGKGFVIAPFHDPASGINTIPLDFIPNNEDFIAENSSIPVSTSKIDYWNEVEYIIKTLCGNTGKIVAARVIRIDIGIDLNATFSALCEAYPEAFVFIFSTSFSSTWIGASPELLLRVDNDELHTMALAGTKPEDDDTPWDRKNIEEQSMVEDFIRKCLKGHCCCVRSGSSFTKKAGYVKHICTEITARPNKDLTYLSSSIVGDILCDLSPTPALCGSDREIAFRIIKEKENFSREMYGGFCGPNEIYGQTEFYVNLRSAKCSPSATAVFAGGGITPLSNPEDEWHETEIKSNTIITKLKRK